MVNICEANPELRDNTRGCPNLRQRDSQSMLERCYKTKREKVFSLSCNNIRIRGHLTELLGHKFRTDKRSAFLNGGTD